MPRALSRVNAQHLSAPGFHDVTKLSLYKCAPQSKYITVSDCFTTEFNATLFLLGTNKTKNDYTARYKVWQVYYPGPNAAVEKQEKHAHFRIALNDVKKDNKTTDNLHVSSDDTENKRTKEKHDKTSSIQSQDSISYKRHLLSESEAMTQKQSDPYVCHGKYRHFICVFGLGDLGALTRAQHLFANKFEYHYSPLTSECLAEYIWSKVEQEVKGTGGMSSQDLQLYRELDFVKEHQ